MHTEILFRSEMLNMPIIWANYNFFLNFGENYRHCYFKDTFMVLLLAMCNTPSTALTSWVLICWSRKLNLDILFFQWSSSALGPMSSASLLICSLSASTWMSQRKSHVITYLHNENPLATPEAQSETVSDSFLISL